MLGPSSVGDEGSLPTSGPRPKGSLTQGHALAGWVPVALWSGSVSCEEQDWTKEPTRTNTRTNSGVPKAEAKGLPQGV